MRIFSVLLIPLLWLTFGQAATAGPAQPAYSQIQIAPNLPGVLYKPAGDGPFPAVIALHGCGGLAHKKGPITSRFQEWGARLVAQGYAVLFPDSFAGRGLASQCRVRKRSVRASRERIVDAEAALGWLAAQPWAKADHIVLLGWSNGATTALSTIRTKPNGSRSTPDFRSALAFYPGCARLRRTAWSARVPTLVLIGAADDWTPARTCQQMVDNARGRSALAQIVTYPGAYHQFDRPNYPVRVLNGIATSAETSGRVHAGTNPRAREDAIKRVSEWLAR